MSEEDRERTANRLRESAKKAADESYLNGYAAGREWVHEDNGAAAEAAELQRLQLFHDCGEWPGFFSVQGRDSAYTIAWDLFFKMHPNKDGSRRAATEFWECIVGDDDHHHLADGYWLHGFAAGALSAWSEVEQNVALNDWTPPMSDVAEHVT